MSALAISRDYFRLSNDQDIESISSLFVEDATYSSDNTGLFFGRQDIMEMMGGFFNAFSSLHWSIDSIEEKTPYIVELHFTFVAENTEGESVERQGIEKLVIVNEKIRHIDVRTP